MFSVYDFLFGLEVSFYIYIECAPPHSSSLKSPSSVRLEAMLGDLKSRTVFIYNYVNGFIAIAAADDSKMPTFVTKTAIQS